MKCIFVILSSFLLAVMPLYSAESNVVELRHWTSSDGKKLEARLIKVKWKQAEGGSWEFDLVLLNKTGKPILLPLEKLSDADQKLTMEWLKNNPTGIAPPKPPYHWPRDYNTVGSSKFEYVRFDEKRQAHMFKTRHFDFYMDERLTDSTVSKCVDVFDSIVEAIDSLPMQLDVIPGKNKPRYEAMLVSTWEKYYQLGGPKMSGGVFFPDKSLTLIPFESLGIEKKGNKWVFDGKKRRFDTLLHELTHHSTSHWSWKPSWVEEGFAEYMATVPYQSGRFLFTNPLGALASGVRKYKETTWEQQIIPNGVFQMTSLEQLMNFGYEQFYTKEGNGSHMSRNYASGMVLVGYFLHLDGQGDGGHFIQWMHEWNAAVLKRQPKQYAPLLEKYLLRGRSYAELEKDVQDKMSKKGLRIEFSAAPGGKGVLTDGGY